MDRTRIVYNSELYTLLIAGLLYGGSRLLLKAPRGPKWPMGTKP